jgi:glycine cleavage system aminomethyltransferase T
VAGPHARDVLETATGAAPGQRFMKAATISIGMAP